jgi:hypothetical protein
MHIQHVKELTGWKRQPLAMQSLVYLFTEPIHALKTVYMKAA